MSEEVNETVETQEEAGTGIVLADIQAISPKIQAASEAFITEYRRPLKKIGRALKSLEAVEDMIETLPEEFQQKSEELLELMNPELDGMIGDNTGADFPELRLYHGTGNDKNRPERQVPGDMYLTTKENVGDKFTGTILAIVTGNTLWGDKDAGEDTRMPLCQSMDRKMGSAHGVCSTCPYEPWKNGQSNRCQHDILMYMLNKEMTEIVKVRFAKTSLGAGQQLIRYLKHDRKMWKRWYTLTTEEQVSKEDNSIRWFIYNVEKISGEEGVVHEDLHPFLEQISLSIRAAYIMPSIARVYALAEQGTPEDEVDVDPGASKSVAETGTLSAEDAEEAGYGDFGSED